MTVKIVRPPPEKEVTCKHCCTVLSYTTSDTEEEVYQDYTGGVSGTAYIRCPVCGHKVILKSW